MAAETQPFSRFGANLFDSILYQQAVCFEDFANEVQT
jgi:hypothetical protein